MWFLTDSFILAVSLAVKIAQAPSSQHQFGLYLELIPSQNLTGNVFQVEYVHFHIRREKSEVFSLSERWTFMIFNNQSTCTNLKYRKMSSNMYKYTLDLEMFLVKIQSKGT